MNSWHDRHSQVQATPSDTLNTRWTLRSASEQSPNTNCGETFSRTHSNRTDFGIFFSSLSIFISSLRKIDEVIVEPSSPATVYYTQHLRLGYRDYVQSITTKRGIHVMFYDTWWSFNIYTFRNTLFFLFRYMYMFFGWHKPLGSADVILCRESTVFFLLEFGDNTGVNINNKTNDISSIIGVHMKIHLFTHKLQI